MQILAARKKLLDKPENTCYSSDDEVRKEIRRLVHDIWTVCKQKPEKLVELRRVLFT